MENLNKIIRELNEELAATEDSGGLEPSTVVASDVHGITLPEVLRGFYEIGNPIEVEMPWLIEWLSLFSREDLDELQEGYRFSVGEPDQLTPDWQPQWLVIGECSGDPIIADTNRPETPILMAVHGVGSWSPKQISPSFSAFLEFLVNWLRFYRERRGQLHDDDGELLPAVKAALSDRVANHLPPADRDNLIEFSE